MPNFQTDTLGVLNGQSLYAEKGFADVTVSPPAEIPAGQVARWVSTVDLHALEYGDAGTGSWELVDDNRQATLYTADGEYSLGGLPVLVKNGKAVLAHMDRVAGSTLQFHQALQRAARISRLPPCELVKCSSWNQARSLGLQGYGKIEPGYAADFTVSDQDWNPQQTWVAGQPRWKKA